MKKLASSMEKINSSALKIDDTLKLKRSEIQKLDIINKDLQKVAFYHVFKDLSFTTPAETTLRDPSGCQKRASGVQAANG